MVGCGLRVSEACNLKLEEVQWSTEHPWIRFRGKGDRERVVPLNLEVQDALRTWLERRGDGGGPYVFGSLRTGRRLSRKTVWAALKRYAARAGLRPVHPHMLRHTFGTNLADREVPGEQIQALMGHVSFQSTVTYIKVSAQRKEAAVDQLDQRPGWVRWFSRLRNRDFRFWGPPGDGGVFTAGLAVGRQTELQALQRRVDRRIHTLVIGEKGVGKKHLLDQLQGERIIRVKALFPIKDAVLEIARALYEQGYLPGALSPSPPGPENSRTEPTATTPPPDVTGPTQPFAVLEKRHTRTKISGWLQMIQPAVEPDEWVLVIDDLSQQTPKVGGLIDPLRESFTLVAALETVKPGFEAHVGRFDRLPLENLPDPEARQLIGQWAAQIRLDIGEEDYPLLERTVLHESRGNPQAIIDHVTRLSREGRITSDTVAEMEYRGPQRQFDLTGALVVLLIVLVASRYFTRAFGDVEAYVFFGFLYAVFIGIRFLLYRSRG